MPHDPTPAAAPLSTTRAIGTLLAALSIAEVAVMAHHPTANGHDIATLLDGLGKVSSMAALVHGTLIAAMAVVFFCFTEFAMWRGMRRPLVRAGLIGYGLGVVAMLGAALIDGFVIEAMAARLPHATGADLQVASQLMAFCFVLNRVLANTGAIAMSAAIACWSLHLLHDRGMARWIGAFGCLVAAVPLLGIPLGLLKLDMHGMTLVVLLQAAWAVGVGVLMRGAGRDGSSAR